MKIFDPKLTGSIEIQSEVSGSILPSTTEVFDLGSPTARWRDIYLSGSTIDLGGTKITTDASGDISFQDGGGNPKKIKVEEILVGSGNNQKRIKLDDGKLSMVDKDGNPDTSIMGHIIPHAHNLYDLGSPTAQWRDLYLSSGSLYIDGTQVLSSDSTVLTVTTDTGQSLKLLETGADDITLQTDTGNIELKGTVEILSGKKIIDSAGNVIQFGDSLGITGSIEVSGTVDGIDLQAMSSSLASRISSLDNEYATDAELNAVSASVKTFATNADTTLSSSLAIDIKANDSRLDTLEAKNLISQSAQIASDISGSVTSTSASLAADIATNTSNISNNSSNISSLNASTSSYLLNTTDTLTGNLTVTGTLTAQQFNTEFVSASILFDSGSTKFGDTLDDNHDFTGSLNISGGLSVDGTVPTWNQDTTGTAATASYVAGGNIDGSVASATTASYAETGPFLSSYSETDTLATVTARGASTSTSSTFSGGLVASGGISGLTLSNGITGTNFNITNVNQLEIADPGEGIVWKNGTSGDISLHTVDDSNDNILYLGGTGASMQINGNRVLTTADEGSGNGLDADTVDSLQASQFLRSDDDDTATGTYTFSGQINLTQTANTIGGATITNGSLVIGNGTTGIGIDNNEIHSAGVLYIGTNTGDLILRPSGNVVNASGNRFLTTADEGSGNGLDADTLDGVQASQFIRSDVDDIVTNKQLRFYSNDAIESTSGGQASLEVYQDTAGADAFMAFHVAGDYAAYFGLDGASNDFVVGGWSKGAVKQRVFHDGYHPNADKWTAARTITLGGDLTGNVSIDGSSNVTLSAQVVNDSHTHDSRYYTEAESDSRFVNVTGDTMTGDIDMDDNDVLDARSVRFVNHEGSDFGTATGTLMFDENFYSDTEYGSTSIWNGNGGGLAIYNEDGWGRIITDANMQWLNANFNSVNATDLYIDDQIISTGDTNTYFQFHAADQARIVCAGAEVMEWGNNYVKLNDNDTLRLGAGSDLRIWHDGSNHYFRNYNHAEGDFYFQGEDNEGTNHALLYLITDTSRPYVRLFEDGAERLRTISTGVQVYGEVQLDDSNTKLLKGSSNALNITTDSGNVNIGPQSTSYCHMSTDRPRFWFNKQLTVETGIVASYNEDLQLRRADSSADRIQIRATSIGFFLDSAEDMRLENDGDLHVESDVIAYSTTISDSRLKDDVITIGGALDKVKRLRGVEYTWNKGGRKDQRDLGLIAQEVEKVIPEIVREKKMPLMDDSDTKYKTVDYEKLTAVLIEGMKEQQETIENQQKQIDELKELVNKLISK